MKKHKELQKIWEHYQRSGSLHKTSLKYGMSREGLRKLLMRTDETKYKGLLKKKIVTCNICRTRKPDGKNSKICRECRHIQTLLGNPIVSNNGMLLHKFHPKGELPPHPNLRYNRTIAFNRLIIELNYSLFPPECFKFDKKLKGVRIFVWLHSGYILKSKYNVLKDFSITSKSDMIGTPLKVRGINFKQSVGKIICKKDYIVDLLLYKAILTTPYASVLFNLIEQIGNLEIIVHDLEYYAKTPCKSIRNASDPYATQGRMFLGLGIIEIFRKALIRNVFMKHNPERNKELLRQIRITIIHELEHYSGLRTERPMEKMSEENRVLRIIKNLQKKIGGMNWK